MTASNAPVSMAANPGQYLSFQMRGQAYGVSVASVREINQMSHITEVPQTQKMLAGVMNLRGKVIPVMNLRERLGIERTEPTKKTCIIVIESDLGLIGMIVDSVNSVIELSAAQIEPAPTVGVSDQGVVIGMGKLENEVIVLLDIVRCLSSADFARAG